MGKICPLYISCCSLRQIPSLCVEVGQVTTLHRPLLPHSQSFSLGIHHDFTSSSWTFVLVEFKQLQINQNVMVPRETEEELGDGVSAKKQQQKTSMSIYHETVQVSGGQSKLVLKSFFHMHILHETCKA